jgi:hypothetical protein
VERSVRSEEERRSAPRARMAMSRMSESLAPSASLSSSSAPPPPPGMSASALGGMSAPPPPPGSMSAPAPSSSSSSAPEPTASISIKEWTPDTPYINAMKSLPTVEEQYKSYHESRKQYFASPAFYLDCATFFFNSKDSGARKYAEMILTS